MQNIVRSLFTGILLSGLLVACGKSETLSVAETDPAAAASQSRTALSANASVSSYRGKLNFVSNIKADGCVQLGILIDSKEFYGNTCKGLATDMKGGKVSDLKRGDVVEVSYADIYNIKTFTLIQKASAPVTVPMVYVSFKGALSSPIQLVKSGQCYNVVLYFGYRGFYGNTCDSLALSLGGRKLESLKVGDKLEVGYLPVYTNLGNLHELKLAK